MYRALGETIKVTGRPPPPKPPEPPSPPVEPPPVDPVVPSWARGVIAIAITGGALVFLLRVAEEREKFGWRIGDRP